MLGPGRGPPKGVPVRVLTGFSGGGGLATLTGGGGMLGAALDLTFVVAIFFIPPLHTGNADQALRAVAPKKQAELYNLWQ